MSVQPLPTDETPRDGYGPGYLEYSIRTAFRDLCRAIGRKNAREVVTEIMDSENDRRRQ